MYSRKLFESGGDIVSGQEREVVLNEFGELEPHLPMLPFLAVKDDYEEVFLRAALPIGLRQPYEEIEDSDKTDGPGFKAADIIKAVADALEVPVVEITGQKRDKRTVVARHAAMYLVRQHTNCSYPMIGGHFNRDHTSVQSAVKKITKMRDNSQSSREVMAVEQAQGNLLAGGGLNEESRLDGTHYVVAITRDGLFQFPVFELTDKQRYLLGIDADMGLDWTGREVHGSLWSDFGRDGLMRLLEYRHKLHTYSDAGVLTGAGSKPKADCLYR